MINPNILNVIAPPAGATGPAGSNGTDGINGTNGNTIISGSGAPSSGTGVNGDWYMDESSFMMYGPKTSGSWGSGTNLVGPTGATGSPGPAGAISSITPNTPSRSLGTAFQPSSTNHVRVCYTVAQSVTNPLLAGSSVAQVQLLSDTNNPPTTIRCRARMASSVGVAVAISITQEQSIPLEYLVPAGHYVRLVATTSGTASNSISDQVEETLS